MGMVICDIKHLSRGLLKTCQVWEPQIQALLVNSEDALVGAAKARKGNLVYDFSLNPVKMLWSGSIPVIVVWKKVSYLNYGDTEKTRG